MLFSSPTDPSMNSFWKQSDGSRCASHHHNDLPLNYWQLLSAPVSSFPYALSLGSLPPCALFLTFATQMFVM